MTHRTTTFSGCVIDYENPIADQIDIVDIATALSRECRFAGHGKYFYSVAQHSVVASRYVAPGFELEALLHDASEAYLKDIPKPLKKLLPCYQKIEINFDAVIRSRFNLPMHPSSEVSYIDEVLVLAELRDLFDNKQDVSLYEVQGIIPKKIWPLSPELACDQFLARYEQLAKGRV